MRGGRGADISHPANVGVVDRNLTFVTPARSSPRFLRPPGGCDKLVIYSIRVEDAPPNLPIGDRWAKIRKSHRLLLIVCAVSATQRYGITLYLRRTAESG